MASRNTARRHKGSSSHKTRGWVVTDLQAVEVVKFWKAADRRGFVYLIQEGDDGPIKIGAAHDPQKRAAMLQCGNPRELRIARLLLGDSETEHHLHAFWRPSAHIRGEWFGQGHEQAILKSADRIAQAQIEAYRQGNRQWADLVIGVALKALFAKHESEAA